MIQRFGPYVLIAMLAFMAYGPILWDGAGFSHPDDEAASHIKCCDFRPILALTYQFNQNYGGWMVVNFGLHVLASLLLLYVTTSPIAASLFAVHPMAADAVASVAGRSAELMAVGVLLAIAIATRSKLLGLLFGACAALGSIAFLPGYFATIYVETQPAQYMGNYVSAVASYIVPSMFLPLSLSADPAITYGLFSEIGGWMLLVAAVALASSRIVVRQDRIGFALLALPLIPYMFVPLPDVFFEHRAYLALAGAAILTANFLRSTRLASYALIALFIILAQTRAQVYASPLSLWEDAAAKAPLKGRPHINLGGTYARLDRWSSAQSELETAVSVAPELPAAWHDLMMVHVLHGRMAQANQVADARDNYLKSRKEQ